MNRKAIQLTISTLILIILGIAVLIALIVALTGGLERFRTTTDPYIDTTEAIAIRDACNLACDSGTPSAYCCIDHTLNDETINCNEPKIAVNCPTIDCSSITC